MKDSAQQIGTQSHNTGTQSSNTQAATTTSLKHPLGVPLASTGQEAEKVSRTTVSITSENPIVAQEIYSSDPEDDFQHPWAKIRNGTRNT